MSCVAVQVGVVFRESVLLVTDVSTTLYLSGSHLQSQVNSHHYASGHGLDWSVSFVMM